MLGTTQIQHQVQVKSSSSACYTWYKYLKSNSITLSGRRQVRSRFEAGRRPAASWNLAYHLAR